MPDFPIFRLLIAAVVAATIAIIAQRRRLLDHGGAIAATLIGATLVGAGGWWAGSLLVTFFVTSSLLSTSAHESPSRTWQQVIANGGPATLFALLAIALDRPALMVGCAAAIAGATADTWATEIGRRSGAIPRAVISLRQVPIGTSGAISLPGTIATVVGALLIATLAVLLRPIVSLSLPATSVTLVAITAGGAGGSLLDTVLGATAQARYRCRHCGLVAESLLPDHEMQRTSGVPFLTNDTVNAVASLAAGCIACIIAILT